MANTVPVLNFTNTFGDLVSAQNRAAIELNNLGANTYTKDSGTLILNGAGTGLTVTNAGLLGSVVVLNTISSGGSISTQSSVFVNGSGSALEVANNSLLRGNVVTNNLTANNVIRATTLNASGNVIANDITANNLIRTDTLNAQGNVFVNNLQSNGAIFGASANIVGRIITNSLVSNTSIDGSTLVISNQSTTNDLQANNVVNTAIVVASNRVIGQNIQANTGLSTNTLTVSSIGFVNSLQANSSVNTATATVTGTTFTNLLQANSSVNTATISVTGTGFVNVLQANSFINTPNVLTNNAQANTLSVSGGTFANTIVANTSIAAPILVVTNRIDANSAPVSFFNAISTTGQVSVGGNFVINGSTVYNTNTFTINANSSVGFNGTFGVNRGLSGANAAIRWNEAQNYWDIRDVNNPTSFSKILTANLISDSISSTSSDTLASSLAANTLNNALQANVATIQGQIASINSSIVNIQGVDNGQNTTITSLNNYAATGFARANTSSNTFIGTSGSANATGGITTFTSTNGVTIAGSANTLTINTPQDLRTSAGPSFNSLTLTNPLNITQGGTSATSSAAALTNLLPSAAGVPAGYVLATNGPGTYYWAAGGTGGGGGATPGTTINSTRLSYIANGSGISYTTPTYIPGASQLRVYFDGVRQFASTYTETSSTVVTFNTAVASGINILVEVDGYINNPYYANNITFTAPFGGIVSTANTIQLAIQDLETRKAALSSASFSGTVTGVTIDTNASNTSFATTAFVKNALNNSNTYSISVSGNAGTVTGGVYTTGNQTIAGVKTFTSTIQGNANTASFATTQAVTVSNDTVATTAFVRSIVPSGVILMWSGSIATIPSGWLLCNGTNGTPDLRDRFIVGAGSTYAVGATGGAATFTLSVDQLPSHTHSVSASGTTSIQSNGHTHTFSGVSGAMNSNAVHSHGVSDPGHSHSIGYQQIGGWQGPWQVLNSNDAFKATTASFTGISINNANIDHTHSYSGTTSDISANHTHTVTVTGTSGSTGSGSSIENRPPYYALAYIMKS